MVILSLKNSNNIEIIYMNDKDIGINLNKLIRQISELVADKNRSKNEKLQGICDILALAIPRFDWVGFYIPDPEADRELVLGPFNGEPTEHTRIPFGKGICGQSADTEDTFVVQDVNEADNYISCSADVQSEIVVPVMKNNTFVAELDIDSHAKNSITEEHRELLEKICDIAAGLF